MVSRGLYGQQHAKGKGVGPMVSARARKRARSCPVCQAPPNGPCVRKTGAGQMVEAGGQYEIPLKSMHRER